jgi:thiol:disulfide interchange protein
MEWVKRVFGLLILLFAVYYALLGRRLLMDHEMPSGGEENLVRCDGSGTCFYDALSAAHAAGQPVFIDFWADWCKNCHAMDATTLQNPAVLKRLDRYQVIQIDATDSKAPPVKEILDRFGVVGLPTYIILEPVNE